MKNLILLTSCLLNLSMLAQWNSKKIADQPWSEEGKSQFTPKQYNAPAAKKAPVIQNDIALNLFPDPSSGTITVPVENDSPQTNVCVYDALGKCVHNESTVKKHDEINLSDQPKGVYLMEITSGDQVTVKKIVVE